MSDTWWVVGGSGCVAVPDCLATGGAKGCGGFGGPHLVGSGGGGGGGWGKEEEADALSAGCGGHAMGFVHAVRRVASEESNLWLLAKAGTRRGSGMAERGACALAWLAGQECVIRYCLFHGTICDSFLSASVAPATTTLSLGNV